jgi:hypothetical protein
MKNLFRFSVLACQILVLLAFTQSLEAQPLRKATFELKNEIIFRWFSLSDWAKDWSSRFTNPHHVRS